MMRLLRGRLGAGPPASAGLLQVRVAAVRDEALGIRAYELVRADGGDLPAFEPGAHIDVRLHGGLLRPYSLCSDPADRSGWVIAVKRVSTSRGGSRAMHERVRPGDVLTVNPPRSNFALVEGANHHLLLAAGIGVTPLLAMAYRLQRREQPFALHYFASSLEHAAFVHELVARFEGRVHLHLGLERSQQAARLESLLRSRRDGHHAYVCGPDGFMQRALQTAAQGGWPAEAVHMERFHGDAQALAQPRGGFSVRLARSGRVVHVSAQQSLAQALCAAGVPVPTSCGEGVCGTCITRVIEGDCDHRDSILSPDQRARGRHIAPCVSRARGELVLDL